MGWLEKGKERKEKEEKADNYDSYPHSPAHGLYRVKQVMYI
jgi:hypothetical protein